LGLDSFDDLEDLKERSEEDSGTLSMISSHETVRKGVDRERGVVVF
jgi:hypothetical protein